MNTHELSADQMRELKERYLCGLADDGHYAETLETDHDEPSWWDIAHAGELVPDEWIHQQWEGYDFTEDDFFASRL